LSHASFFGDVSLDVTLEEYESFIKYQIFFAGNLIQIL